MSRTGQSAGKRNLVEDIQIIDFPAIKDSRGSLTFAESGKELPFDAKRMFCIYDVSDGSTRGGHGHRESQMVLTAVAGSFSIRAYDGEKEAVFLLDSPNKGLYIPTGIWTILENFSSGAVCVVLSDTVYNPFEYLHSRSEFEAWCAEWKQND